MSLPLPALTFYRLPDVSPAAATRAALLDCFYSSFIATTDYRGTSLASTHQWTGGARYQNAGVTEAAYVAAPSGSPMTLAPKLLFAGAASQGSATMQTDSFLSEGVHVGIGKNTGAFNAWNNAAPFTSGQWSGFNRAFPTAANATATIVRPYVSEESWVFDVWTSATAHYIVIIGAIVEARTDDSTTCESDSRLYGCFTSGSAGALTSSFLTNPGTIFLDHSTATTGAPHAYVFAPGSGSLYTCGRKFVLQTAASASTGIDQDQSGAWMGDDIPIARSSSSTNQGGRTLGRLREVYVGGAIQGARTLRDGSTDILHVIGYDTLNADDALILPAAA